MTLLGSTQAELIEVGFDKLSPSNSCLLWKGKGTMNGNSRNLRFVWLALYAALIFFVGGRWNIPLAAWLAPVFAIRFYRDSDRAWRGFFWLWLASALPTILGWRGATAMGLFHPAAEPAFFILLTPVSLIPYVLDRLYARRFAPSLWLTLVFPVALTAVDFFSASGSPFGSFGAGAYAQRDVTWLMQLSALGGLWGIVFVSGWFASVVNFAWEQRFQWRAIRRVVLTYAAVLLAVAAFGAGRLLLAPPPAQTVPIAGFSLPAGQVNALMAQVNSGDREGFRTATRDLHRTQLDAIRTAAATGAQIVALQEGAGIGFSDDVAQLLADAAAVAQEQQIYIVLPTFAIDPAVQAQPENVVRIIDPAGAVVLEHVKFGGTQFEGSVAGSGVLQTVDTPFGRLSAVICWDADFPDVMRQAGAQEVDLLFVPSNDWYELRDIHAGMATFRAVENGMAIFRQTGAGVSLVADAYGRILNRVDSFAAAPTGAVTDQQQVATPVGAVATLYPLAGDAFGWIMQFGLVGLVVFLWIKRRR
jgi:apolipoprotein N-acyltransferase